MWHDEGACAGLLVRDAFSVSCACGNVGNKQLRLRHLRDLVWILQIAQTHVDRPLQPLQLPALSAKAEPRQKHEDGELGPGLDPQSPPYEGEGDHTHAAEPNCQDECGGDRRRT